MKRVRVIGEQLDTLSPTYLLVDFLIEMIQSISARTISGGPDADRRGINQYSPAAGAK
jgi:hypothetical protein